MGTRAPPRAPKVGAKWKLTRTSPFPEAAEGGTDAAADGVPPPAVDAHRRAAKLTAAQELRRARHELDTADLGMVSDAAATLPVLEPLQPPPASTGPEYSPAEEPPDLRRAPPSWGGNADGVRRDLDVPSWRMWVNRCLAGRCYSRTAAFLASGTVFALHKDDPAAREERAKTGEPLRVRPLGVGSVLVRLASAHALVHVGADARETMGPTDPTSDFQLLEGMLMEIQKQMAAQTAVVALLRDEMAERRRETSHLNNVVTALQAGAPLDSQVPLALAAPGAPALPIADMDAGNPQVDGPPLPQPHGAHEGSAPP
eukprot:jgi/Tetstr1/465952/TSEL_000915.t1